MPEPQAGWVKVYRQLRKWWGWQDSELVHVWTFCLLCAHWEPSDQFEAGDVAFSMREAARELGMPATTFRRKISLLLARKELAQKSARPIFVASVTGWPTYQAGILEVGAANGAARPHIRNKKLLRTAVDSDHKVTFQESASNDFASAEWRVADVCKKIGQWHDCKFVWQICWLAENGFIAESAIASAAIGAKLTAKSNPVGLFRTILVDALGDAEFRRLMGRLPARVKWPADGPRDAAAGRSVAQAGDLADRLAKKMRVG